MTQVKPILGETEPARDEAPPAPNCLQLNTGTVAGPRQIVVTGQQGVGKSSFAAAAPNNVFLDCEGGLRDIDCTSFKTTSWSDAGKQLGYLLHEEHNFETVTVDTIDWLEKFIWTDVCEAHGVDNIASFDWGKGYAFATEYWRRFLERLSMLRRVRNMHVILLAHTKIAKYAPPDLDAYDRYIVAIHKDAAALVQEWADEVFFACFETHTVTDGGRKRAIGGDRVLRTKEQPYCQAKCRLRGVPDEIPLDWGCYAEYLKVD